MKEKIKRLVKEKNVVILAHNYQPPEIQDIADLCGDSLELSIKASKTNADIIVFCGVRFMAETASILCPDKTILLPVQDAGCPMADMVTPDALKKEKQRLLNSTKIQILIPAEFPLLRKRDVRQQHHLLQLYLVMNNLSSQ